MFNSGILVKDLVEELKSEVDIALDIPNATYVTLLNSLQQLLYTEVIKEQKKTVLKSPFKSNMIDLSTIAETNENTPIFEDIHTVYADDTQLIKSTVTSGVIFPNTFYKDADKLAFNIKEEPKDIKIIYYVKPALIQVDADDEIDGSYVMIPIEFIEIAKSKLRGEVYKLANEYDIASNWLSDYNILIETFKVWLTEKLPIFGM